MGLLERLPKTSTSGLEKTTKDATILKLPNKVKETPQTSKKVRHIYFFQNLKTKAIKIGLTENVEKKLRTLQDGNDSELRLLGYFPGNRELLEHMHKKFKGKCLRDDWFTDSESIYVLVTLMCSN